MRLGRWWLAAIVFGLMRLVVIDYPSLADDPDAYRAIAEGWSATGTMGRLSEDGIAAPTAYRSPLYPWLLSWFVKTDGLWLPGVAALHILLGSLTCVLTIDLTRRSSRLSPRGELQELQEFQEFQEQRPSANKTQALESASRREATTQETIVAVRSANVARSSENPRFFRGAKGDICGAKADIRGAKHYVPWLAGFAVAFDPILVRQSSLIMTETVAAFLSVLIWWMWVVTQNKSERSSSFWFALIGVLFGISSLLRPSTLAWCGLLVVALSVRTWRLRKSNQCKFSFSKLIFLVVGIFIVLSPWAIRNRMTFASTIWTTTHGGYTLLLANNPVLFQHLEDEGISRKWDEDRFHKLWSMRTERDPREAGFWNETLEEETSKVAVRSANVAGNSEDPRFFRGAKGDNGDRQSYSATDRPFKQLDEVADDHLANQVAWQTILRSPWTFAKACVARVLWLWALWPFQEKGSLVLTILIAAWYLVVFSLFAFGCCYGFLKWFSDRSSAIDELHWLPAVTLIIGLTAVHVVYWSNMRMRAPLMPIIVVIAAMGISKMFFRRSASYNELQYRELPYEI